jgi:peroxin-11B
MVADALVYHPTVAHYLKFVATTTGRDKLLRTIQYFARFYAWYLLRTNGSPAEIAPWAALKRQFGLVRKVMRAGKNVEHLKAAAVAADAKTMDPVLRYATVGRQLGYAGYLSFDLATLLDALGVKKSAQAKSLQREAYRFWAMGLLCSLVVQMYSLYRLNQREAKVDKKEGEGVVESKRIAMYVSPSPASGTSFQSRIEDQSGKANNVTANEQAAEPSYFRTFAIWRFRLRHLDGSIWTMAWLGWRAQSVALLACKRSGRRRPRSSNSSE